MTLWPRRTESHYPEVHWDGTAFTMSEHDLQRLIDVYRPRGINVEEELANAATYSVGKKRRHRRPGQFIVNWLNNAVRFHGGKSPHDDAAQARLTANLLKELCNDE